MTYHSFISDNKDTSAYCKGNLLSVPPGEPQNRRAISIKHLKDEHTLGVDTQHDACLGPLLRKHSMEMNPIFCQPLAHL